MCFNGLVAGTKTILVVEDDPSIAAHLVRGLKDYGWHVELLCDGSGVVDHVRTHRPALLVLDLMQQHIDGFEVLEALRQVSQVPVIVLTAKRALTDRLQSFRLGACDFMTKPYFIEELDARIRARLGDDEDTIEVGAMTIDREARRVWIQGAPCELTRHEFDILLYLAERPGRAVQRATLVDAALAADDDTGPRAVDVHVSRIRAKLGDCAAHVATVRGLGYRFDREIAR